MAYWRSKEAAESRGKRNTRWGRGRGRRTWKRCELTPIPERFQWSRMVWGHLQDRTGQDRVCPGHINACLTCAQVMTANSWMGPGGGRWQNWIQGPWCPTGGRTGSRTTLDTMCHLCSEPGTHTSEPEGARPSYSDHWHPCGRHTVASRSPVTLLQWLTGGRARPLPRDALGPPHE